MTTKLRYRVRIFGVFGENILDPTIYDSLDGCVGAKAAARYTFQEGWTSLRGGFSVKDTIVEAHVPGDRS